MGCVHVVVFSLIPSPPQLSSPAAHVAHTHTHTHTHTRVVRTQSDNSCGGLGTRLYRSVVAELWLLNQEL